MKGSWKLFFSFCMLHVACCIPSIAQERNIPDTAGVVIYADARLDVLMTALKPRTSTTTTTPGNTTGGKSVGSIRTGRGFRIQIYSGNDRLKANQIKLDFLGRFPGVHAYMSYNQPIFRVKVGDFVSRGEANALYQELRVIYNPSSIVPDIIAVSNVRKGDNNRGNDEK